MELRSYNSFCAMIGYFWLFIKGISSATASNNGLAISIPDEHEFDNLAIETALEDEIESNKPDTKLSDNIQTVIHDKNDFRRYLKDGGGQERFTDFIQHVIEILSQYTDTDLEHFFEIFNDEVRKYHYNGCKFYELTDNDAFRKFIATQFDEIRNKQAADLRPKIEKIARQIEEATSNRHEKELVDYINSLYRQDSFEKFNKFLAKINNYRLKVEEDSDLVKIVRDGIRTLIFNHYTKLDYNTRAALKFKLDQYWEHMTAVPVLRAELNAKEYQLLENRYNHAGMYYFTKRNKHKSATKTHRRIKHLKFRTLYPKFVMEWKIMNSPPRKRKQSAHRSTTELSFYKEDAYFTRARSKQTETDDFEFIRESMVQHIKHSTKDILRQNNADNENTDVDSLNENYPNDEDNSDLIPTSAYIDSDTATVTYLSLYMEDMRVPTTKQYRATETEKVQSPHRHRRPSLAKDEGSKKKRVSVATLHAINFPDLTTNKLQVRNRKSPRDELSHMETKHKGKHLTTENILAVEGTATKFMPTIIRRAQIQKPLHQATMRHFVPNRIEEAKDSRLDRMQLNFQRRQSDKPMYMFSNEDASIVDKGLSVEEVKEDDGILAFKRNYNNHLPPNTVLIDEDILARLQKLENQLDNVKSLAENDTEMIKKLKSNIHLGKKISSNQFVLAKVIPCTQDNKELKDPLFIDVDKPHDRTSEINTNGNNDELYMNSRRAMINKVEEIKNKYKGADKNIDNKEGKDYFHDQAKIDFEKEYIPDKDTFNKNMVTLENFLDLNKNTENVYTMASNPLSMETKDSSNHAHSNDMLTKIGLRKLLVKDDKNIAESDTTLINNLMQVSKPDILFDSKDHIEKYKNINRIILEVDEKKTNDTQKYKNMRSRLHADKNAERINTKEKHTTYYLNITINNASYTEYNNNSSKTTLKSFTGASNVTHNKTIVDSLLTNLHMTTNYYLHLSNKKTNATHNLSDDKNVIQGFNNYLIQLADDSKIKAAMVTNLNVDMLSSPKYLQNNLTFNASKSNKSSSETQLNIEVNTKKNKVMKHKLPETFDLTNNTLNNPALSKLNKLKVNITGDSLINKVRFKRNVNPMPQQRQGTDLFPDYVDDKVIDWDSINIHKMFDAMRAKLNISSTTTTTPQTTKTIPRRRMLAVAPTERTKQTVKRKTIITTLTIPTDFNSLLPNNFRNPRKRMHPLDFKYHLNRNPSNLFRRRNNNLPLAPPAGKTIPIESEEAFNIKVRSRLNIRDNAMITRPTRYRSTADMESLFKQLGPLPKPHEIQDALKQPIHPMLSGRRNMGARVTSPPLRRQIVDDEIFADPLLSDIEGALGTKLPSESTTWEPLL